MSKVPGAQRGLFTFSAKRKGGHVYRPLVLAKGQKERGRVIDSAQGFPKHGHPQEETEHKEDYSDAMLPLHWDSSSKHCYSSVTHQQQTHVTPPCLPEQLSPGQGWEEGRGRTGRNGMGKDGAGGGRIGLERGMGLVMLSTCRIHLLGLIGLHGSTGTHQQYCWHRSMLTCCGC